MRWKSLEFAWFTFLFYENFWIAFCVGYLSHTIVIGLCPSMQMSCKDCITFWIHVSHTFPHFKWESSKILPRSSAAQFQCQHCNIFFFAKEQIKPRNAVWQQIRFLQVTSSVKRITLLHEISDKTTNLLSAFSFTSLYAMWVSMTWSI